LIDARIASDLFPPRKPAIRSRIMISPGVSLTVTDWFLDGPLASSYSDVLLIWITDRLKVESAHRAVVSVRRDLMSEVVAWIV
jgi:hypothetical protein